MPSQLTPPDDELLEVDEDVQSHMQVIGSTSQPNGHNIAPHIPEEELLDELLELDEELFEDVQTTASGYSDIPVLQLGPREEQTGVPILPPLH